MALESNKKLSILYILKILQESSDENHLLTQQEIIKKLYSVYGMECERKSIGASLDSLEDFGYDIVRTKKGCFLGNREFEKSEITFLIDAVFSSKIISGKNAKVLIKKLMKFLSKYDNKSFKYLYKADEVSRVQNNQLFYTIYLLNEAIESNKKVRFIYNSFDEHKKLTPKNNAKPFVVSPYFMANNNGKYYLVCNNDLFDNLSNFRIDFITNIEIIDDDSKSIKQLTDYKNGFDIAKYINSNIYMFGSKEIVAKLKLKDNYAINIAIDWFDKNIIIEKQNNEYFATITTNEEALMYWCLQYGEYVELLEPIETRAKIKERLNKMLKKYN